MSVVIVGLDFWWIILKILIFIDDIYGEEYICIYSFIVFIELRIICYGVIKCLLDLV